MFVVGSLVRNVLFVGSVERGHPRRGARGARSPGAARPGALPSGGAERRPGPVAWPRSSRPTATRARRRPAPAAARRHGQAGRLCRGPTPRAARSAAAPGPEPVRRADPDARPGPHPYRRLTIGGSLEPARPRIAIDDSRGRVTRLHRASAADAAKLLITGIAGGQGRLIARLAAESSTSAASTASRWSPSATARGSASTSVDLRKRKFEDIFRTSARRGRPPRLRPPLPRRPRARHEVNVLGTKRLLEYCVDLRREARRRALERVRLRRARPTTRTTWTRTTR